MTWQQIGKFDVRGPRIAIKDAMTLLDDLPDADEWVTIVVEPGSYIVEVFMPVSNHISRVRVHSEGARPVRGEWLGAIEINMAKFGVIDYDNFLMAIGEDDSEYEEWTEMELFDAVGASLFGEIAFKSCPLIFGSSGDGDGCYPVFGLIENGSLVGLECEFEPTSGNKS